MAIAPVSSVGLGFLVLGNLTFLCFMESKLSFFNVLRATFRFSIMILAFRKFTENSDSCFLVCIYQWETDSFNFRSTGFRVKPPPYMVFSGGLCPPICCAWDADSPASLGQHGPRGPVRPALGSECLHEYRGLGGSLCTSLTLVSWVAWR